MNQTALLLSSLLLPNIRGFFDVIDLVTAHPRVIVLTTRPGISKQISSDAHILAWIQVVDTHMKRITMGTW